jgi:hypothetical protein
MQFMNVIFLLDEAISYGSYGPFGRNLLPSFPWLLQNNNLQINFKRYLSVCLSVFTINIRLCNCLQLGIREAYLWRLWDPGLILGRGTNVISSPKHSDLLCDPPSLLPNGYLHLSLPQHKIAGAWDSGLIQGRGTNVISSPKHSDLLCDPPSLLPRPLIGLQIKTLQCALKFCVFFPADAIL